MSLKVAGSGPEGLDEASSDPKALENRGSQRAGAVPKVWRGRTWFNNAGNIADNIASNIAN